MRIVLSLLIATLIGFAGYRGIQLIELSKEVNEKKYDFAEVNKITYGLFNIDIWKDKIFSIIESKADGFEFGAKDLQGFKVQIENYLYGVHSEYIESGKLVEMFMDSQKKDKNKMMGLLMGLFKGGIEDQIKNIDFKDKIPGIADQMMGEFEKKIPELKKQITKQVSDMLVNESTSTLNDRRDVIYFKYSVDSQDAVNAVIEADILAAETITKGHIQQILAALLIAFLLLLFLQKQLTFKLAMVWLTIVCVVCLSLGLALPMIDLDARLSDVDLVLIGESLHFDEQVMYFQSKSIIDVTTTLLQGGTGDLKFVGFLILLFSIILPFLKMLLTTVYLYVKSAQKSQFVQTVIFYLGKWSMADVFVVSIFMAYIGFYGLLNSQLANMAAGSDTVTIETVNYSQFSPGIIFFTLYCLLSIVMSMLIHRKKQKIYGDE
jgi:hypothetical protein